MVVACDPSRSWRVTGSAWKRWSKSDMGDEEGADVGECARERTLATALFYTWPRVWRERAMVNHSRLAVHRCVIKGACQLRAVQIVSHLTAENSALPHHTLLVPFLAATSGRPSARQGFRAWYLMNNAPLLIFPFAFARLANRVLHSVRSIDGQCHSSPSLLWTSSQTMFVHRNSTSYSRSIQTLCPVFTPQGSTNIQLLRARSYPIRHHMQRRCAV